MSTTTFSRITSLLVAAVAVAVAISPSSGAQQQTPNTRAGWPCGGRLDPSYFQVAEGSGGHLLLLAPSEIGDSAALLTAFRSHQETIFRLAGAINPGVREFRVPIDSSVESVLFSISLQCLQTAEVVRPSGALVAGGEGVTDLSDFRAERMVIVTRPESGVWTVRAAGSGVAGVMVQGRSTLGIGEVRFAAIGSTAFTRSPLAGVENVVRIDMSGHATQLDASVVNAAFRRIAPLPLAAGETEGSYVSRFTPATQGFRVLVEGRDPAGLPFQRVHAPLLTAARR